MPTGVAKLCGFGDRLAIDSPGNLNFIAGRAAYCSRCKGFHRSQRMAYKNNRKWLICNEGRGLQPGKFWPYNCTGICAIAPTLPQRIPEGVNRRSPPFRFYLAFDF